MSRPEITTTQPFAETLEEIALLRMRLELAEAHVENLIERVYRLECPHTTQVVTVGDNGRHAICSECAKVDP